MSIKREAVSSFERKTETPYTQNRTSSNRVAGPPSRKGASWGIIVLLYIFFFPAGLVLMLMKLHKEKNNYVANGRVVAIVGWIFFILGIFYALMGFSGSLNVSNTGELISFLLLMLAFFCGGGYALARHGKKFRNIGISYTTLMPIILDSSDGSLDHIASISGKSYEETCKEIQTLIDYGMITEGYIDHNTRFFVSDIYKNAEQPISASPVRETPKMKAPKSVKCPNCGGINIFETDGINLCEFCGSPLE